LPCRFNTLACGARTDERSRPCSHFGRLRALSSQAVESSSLVGLGLDRSNKDLRG
jgi:hypothetical protein